ncbi:MAG: LexA family transcriptional regulator [Ruminococcaceae bacterium]|nr:LexA family transcriptional regulator [Oscillospiraceae bacterium]
MFGKRLKELRDERNYSMDKLIELYNEKYNAKMNKSTLSRYENDLQDPIYTVVVNFADFFGVTIDYLTGNTDRFPSPGVTEDYTTFPVIGEIAAGYDRIATENWDGEKIDIPNSYLGGRKPAEFFVLLVKGDSMYPMYQEGDKVLILKQTTLNYSGQIGAIIYSEDECATLKKIEYATGEDWLKLVPINPNCPPVTIENEALEHCRVLGIPKLVIREVN